ncbi:hypothetical protein [Pedobacter nototheniae]|uniref:hypothetical protein n=1 Tax=Pedobacter nototheniae TaxID=2488994 RepID=UPI00103AFEDF|nr:hypothetical protein [Pedobacter nototheniae]
MEIVTQSIPTLKIWPNTGQIAGIPKNPRFIRDERFAKLVRSIIDHPEMLELRECLVVEYADEFVAIAGNMRLRAVVEASSMSEDEFALIIEEKQSKDNFNDWLAAITELRSTKTIPCKIIPRSATIEQIKAYMIKDNVGFGSDDYDLLANEWDQDDLLDWGMILTSLDGGDDEPEEKEKKSVVRLVIEFDGDLANYDEVKRRVSDIVEEFPDAKLRD